MNETLPWADGGANHNNSPDIYDVFCLLEHTKHIPSRGIHFRNKWSPNNHRLHLSYFRHLVLPTHNDCQTMIKMSNINILCKVLILKKKKNSSWLLLRSTKNSVFHELLMNN